MNKEDKYGIVLLVISPIMIIGVGLLILSTIFPDLSLEIMSLIAIFVGVLIVGPFYVRVRCIIELDKECALLTEGEEDG